MKRFAWGAAAGIIGWLLVQGAALAGWEVTTEMKTGRNKAIKDVAYYQADRIREEAGSMTSVMDFTRKTVIWIDNEKKKYTVMTFDEFRKKARDAAAAAGEAMEKMKSLGMPVPGMGSAPKGKVAVTGIEGAAIAGYACDGYRVTVAGKDKEDLWVSRKAPFLDEIGPAARAELEGLASDMKKIRLTGGYDDAPAYRKAIERGFVMRTVDKESGSVRAVTKVEKKELPASLFEEPKGYAKGSFEELTGMPAGGPGRERGSAGGEESPAASSPAAAPGSVTAPAVDYGKKTADDAKDAAKRGAMEPAEEKKQGALDSIREGTKEGIKKLFKW